MELLEAMQARHSVRRYTDEKIGADVADALRAELDAINAESGLHFALFTDEETGFDGKLHNVKNYIVFAGSGKNLDERIGYYGARAMLKAQMLGLNSCWVALSFNKGAVEKLMTLASGEKIVNALAVGYGETQGNPHKNKPIDKLCSCDGEMPDWFKKGMDCVLLAPTAINQQKFVFTLKNGEVAVKAKLGPCFKIDLGIVKYYFEIGSGKTVFKAE